VGLSACGDRNAPVEDAARTFSQAVADRDGAAACRMLAPATTDELEKSTGKPCDQAILEEDLPEPSAPESVEVYGTAGSVTTATDTMFLGKFQSGWRVTAAGCAAASPGPYDCDVAGG
jgi:hypothetical protein